MCVDNDRRTSNSYKHKGSGSPFIIGLCVLVKVVHYHYTHTCIGNKFPYMYNLSPQISLHVQSPSHTSHAYMYIHNKHTYTQAHTEPPQELVPASWLLVNYPIQGCTCIYTRSSCTCLHLNIITMEISEGYLGRAQL